MPFTNKESTKHRAKKEKAIQKATFRDILNSVKNNQAPSLKLKFTNETVAFDTWLKIRLLDLIKEFTDDGMTVYFTASAWIHELFDISFSEPQDKDRRFLDGTVNRAREKGIREMRDIKRFDQ